MKFRFLIVFLVGLSVTSSYAKEIAPELVLQKPKMQISFRFALPHSMQQYEQALNFSAVSAHDHLIQGLAYYVLFADKQQALLSFSRALNLDSQVLEVYVYRFWISLISGDVQLAIKDLNQILSIDPQFEQSEAYQALLNFVLGKSQQAIELFEQKRPQHLSEYDYYMNLASMKMHSEDFAAASDDWTYLLYLYEYSLSAHYYRALASFQLKDYSEVIYDLSRVIELEPQLPEAFFYRGLASMKLGDLPSAVSDLQQALSLKPAHLPVQEFLDAAKDMHQFEGISG